MKKMRFSVLMCVYFKENPYYFTSSLESVFNQTICPTEVVLIEDGKLTNELDAVVNKFLKKYPNILKVFKFTENRGLGYALHDGILKCNNDIIFRMDSDDICREDRFEKTLKAFQETDADVIGSNIVEYNQDMSHVVGYRIVPENDNQIKKKMRHRNPFNHMTVAYKKNSVLSAGNYLDMKFFEDYYLWARMCVKGCSFYNIQENLVKARGGDEMIDRRGGKKYIQPILNLQKELLYLGIINRIDFFINVSIRIMVSIIPGNIRMAFYRVFLREKSCKNE